MEDRPRALMIEDDDAVARLIRVILENTGFDAAVVTTPLDATREGRRAAPAIIFADVLIGQGLDGATTAALLKAGAGLESTPLILVSSLPREELRVLKAECGACDALVKPFRASELAETAR